MLCSDGKNLNINSGHSEDHSSNQTLSVQTPAIDFLIYNDTVSIEVLGTKPICNPMYV